jgi:hypothetical protein
MRTFSRYLQGAHGAPVIGVVAGVAIVGVGAGIAAEQAWDHLVPESAKEAIDNGLREFGSGVSDVDDAITFWD